MELQTYKSKKPEDQRDLMDQIAKWRRIAESGCASDIEQMIRNSDFAAGYQWDLGVKSDMETRGKYVATVNIIGPQLDQLVGHVVSNPKDITCVNTHGGMREIADLNTALLKHAMEINDGLNLMVQWFHRGAETRRSFVAWFMDYTRDPIYGDLTIRSLPETDCLWDPTCKQYPLDGTGNHGDGAKFFFWDEWVEREWAEQRWPEVKDVFPGASPVIHGVENDPLTQDLYKVPAREGTNVSQLNPETQPDYSSVRYCLTHCWWMEYMECWYWYDTRQSSLDPVIVWKRKDVSKAKKVTEEYPDVYRMIRSVVRICHHTKYIGTQFLEDWIDEFDMAKANLTCYPVVQYCPTFRWGRSESVVESMVGPQETFNWLRSMVVNILKLGPNHGWKIASDVDGYSDILKRHSGEAGQVIDLSKCGGMAERLEPPPLPLGLHELSLESKMEVREVSNIRTENPEKDTEALSGRAILAKQASSATGISPKMANFDWSMRIFGEVGINIIRCSGVYSDDEIKQMIDETRMIDANLLHEARLLVCSSLGIQLPQQPPLPNPAKLQGATPQVLSEVQAMYESEFANYQELVAMIDKQARPMAVQALIDAARNPIAGRYHTSVSLSPYSVTASQNRLAAVAETNQLLLSSGAHPLPERDILEASDIPNKTRLLRERGYA